jgi:hypothetical protein
MVRLQKLHPFSKDSVGGSNDDRTEFTPAAFAPATAPPHIQISPGVAQPPREAARQYTVTPETRAQRISEVSQNQEEIQKRFGLTEAHRVIHEQNKVIQQQQQRELEYQREIETQRAAERERANDVHRRAAISSKPPQPTTPNMNTRVVPLPKDQPLGLDVENFVPHAGKSDLQIIDEVLSDHHGMCQMLAQRLTNIKVLKSLWQQDRKGAVAHVQQLNDPAVSVDFLKQVIKVKDRDLTIDICVGVLPTIKHVLYSTFESHLVVALEGVSTLWHAFGDLVIKTLAAKTHVVDVCLEERKDKCRIANHLFGELRQIIESLKDRKDDVGQRSRILWKELPSDTFD